ncbi:MAG: autoinducer binding domain-containing protein, partial [Pseudooceanicola sp.]
MDLIDLSSLPQPELGLRDFLDRVCEKHELDFAAYAGMDTISQTIHGVVNYPRGWQELYTQKGLQGVDPTLAMASRSIAPVDWGRLRQEPTFDLMFSAAHDFGISHQALRSRFAGP